MSEKCRSRSDAALFAAHQAVFRHISMQQNASSDQGLHYLPLIQQYFKTHHHAVEYKNLLWV